MNSCLSRVEEFNYWHDLCLGVNGWLAVVVELTTCLALKLCLFSKGGELVCMYAPYSGISHTHMKYTTHYTLAASQHQQPQYMILNPTQS